MSCWYVLMRLGPVRRMFTSGAGCKLAMRFVGRPDEVAVARVSTPGFLVS
jgi:hypothetical protein